MTVKERYAGVIGWFSENMPDAATELHYRTPYELLVAVVLSAQCTDKRVNLVTPALFERFPDSARLAAASSDEVFEYIRSVSYPRAKSEHLVAMAQRLEEVYGGRIPDTVEELTTLQGVGRKTANVIVSIIYGKPAMAVDTHVFRVAERIGLTTRSKNPLQTERTLVSHIPRNLLGRAHHWLILHGRYVCTARAPQCPTCGIAPWCRHRQRELEAARKEAQKARRDSREAVRKGTPEQPNE
ncbi:endonuclease III [Millionella massiliensis]|uniref:endonuclease III n=1 Tax=Millionella massiliensis TaxID=1871023 RepID=UPI0024B73385|nr:endonuclease III [Millionella massiliensis]